MVELTEKKVEQLNEMPIVESRVFKSKDGNCLVHKTVITDIKSTKYYDKVLAGQIAEEVEA